MHSRHNKGKKLLKSAASFSPEQSSQTFLTMTRFSLNKQASRTDVMKRPTTDNSATSPTYNCATTKKRCRELGENLWKPLDFLW